MAKNSRRLIISVEDVINKRFKACFWEPNCPPYDKPVQQEFGMSLLIDDESPEFHYAIEKIANDLNKLELHETMFFQTNRDSNNSKGVIIRIR
jgi:hypothetical protein